MATIIIPLLVSLLIGVSQQRPGAARFECGLTQGEPRLPYVLGGKPVTPPNVWPWLVSIQLADSPHVVHCGATMITRKVLLTAAHCIVAGGNTTRDVGTLYAHLWTHDVASDEGTKVTIKRVVPHPYYGRKNTRYSYDLALVELFYPYVDMEPICLPCSGNDDDEYRLRYDFCVIAGWGLKTATELNPSSIPYHARVPLVDTGVCKTHWGAFFDTSSMICAGVLGENPRSTCQGDSGGPLMCYSRDDQRYVLVGVTSFGSFHCGRKPAAFAHIANMKSWIVRTIEKEMDDKVEKRNKGDTCDGAAPPIHPGVTTLMPPLHGPDIMHIVEAPCDATLYEMKRGLHLIANQVEDFHKANVTSAEHCRHFCCGIRDCRSMLYYPSSQDCFLFTETRCQVRKEAVAEVNEDVIYFGKRCNE